MDTTPGTDARISDTMTPHQPGLPGENPCLCLAYFLAVAFQRTLKSENHERQMVLGI
jgi:hypothetical protein